MLSSVLLKVIENFRGVKEGLAWNTTNIQAGTAKVLVFFNKGGLKPELCSPYGRYIATGTCADRAAAAVSGVF